jgi:hypothetical protein
MYMIVFTIKAQHVREFTQLLSCRKRAGVFVHTGRAGRASWQASRGVDLQMISGPQLQKLILGEPLTLFDRIVAASNSTKRMVKTFSIERILTQRGLALVVHNSIHTICG